MSDASAKEIMTTAMFSAFCSAIEAYRQNSGGLPNVMARDLAAIHSNTGFSDLPEPVQKALRESTDNAFRKLLQGGYGVTSKSEPRKFTSTSKKFRK